MYIYNHFQDIFYFIWDVMIPMKVSTGEVGTVPSGYRSTKWHKFTGLSVLFLSEIILNEECHLAVKLAIFLKKVNLSDFFAMTQ